MDGGSEADFLAGVERLDRLLPIARAAARTGQHEVNDGSPLGGLTLSHITETNIATLMVYAAPKGGWHADLVLLNVPPGVPNAIGSQAGAPHATKAEAEAYALHLLTTALIAAERNKTAATKPSRAGVFLFHNFALTLPTEMLAFIANGKIKGRIDFAIRALKRIERMFPTDMTAEDLDGMAHAERIALHGAATILVLEGIYAWPLREDAPPPPAGKDRTGVSA